jgi:hypothetical protein
VLRGDGSDHALQLDGNDHAPRHDGDDQRAHCLRRCPDYMARTAPRRRTGSPARSKRTAAGQRRQARLTLRVPASSIFPVDGEGGLARASPPPSVLLSLLRPCLPSRFRAPRQQAPRSRTSCAGVVFHDLVRCCPTVLAAHRTFFDLWPSFYMSNHGSYDINNHAQQFLQRTEQFWHTTFVAPYDIINYGSRYTGHS